MMIVADRKCIHTEAIEVELSSKLNVLDQGIG